MSEHNFSGALATWKEIHLSELQKTLDAQGIEVVDNQKESFIGRKNLADRTKEFKKIPDEEKVSAFKGLLKSYQQEIDALTKRAKTSESHFLSIYKVLAEAPDPYPLLEAAVDQAAQAALNSELQADLLTLRTENADLKKRVDGISTLEASKVKAEVKAQELESKMDSLVQEKVVQKQNELHATYDEKLRNYEQREQDLQRQLSLVKTQLRDLRVSNDSNQAKLLSHGQKQDQDVLAKLAEMDMLVTDLEHSSSRVATLERRNELLRAEIEGMRSGDGRSDRVKELEGQLAGMESEAERLQRLLETQKERTSEAENVLKARLQEKEKELKAATAELEQLRARVRQYADYDEVKRELEIMKYVEFAGLDEDGEDDDESGEEGYDVGVNGANGNGVRLPDPNADKANAQRGKSLEALLALKNKRILEELTKFRILHSELEASLQEAQDSLLAANAELEKQRALSEKLEIDLLQMENSGKDKGKGRSGEADEDDALAGLDLGKKLANARIPPARASPIPFTSSADTSILPIVTSQRDRFRARNAELEEELRKQFQLISELRAEIKSLQADNLKLYEKVRYMQSYREDAQAQAATVIPTGGRPQADDMSKYRARYEESVNPFEVFRGREATRGYQRLNPLEKGVFALTRTILGNRRARTIFIFYSLGLHLLVVYLTYDLGSASSQVVQPNPYGA